MSEHIDIAIIGGGLVGASIALAMSQNERTRAARIVQFEAQDFASGHAAPAGGKDERHLALNACSWQSLQSLGVHLAPERCRAIEAVHISTRGDFGRVLLRAREHQLREFGRLVPASYLREQLELAQQAQVDLGHLGRRFAQRLTALHATENAVQLQFGADEPPVQASLVIGADGSESTVRKLMGAKLGGADPVQRLDYQASALSFNVSAEIPHLGCAFERFTETGPIAVLPLPGQRVGVVWTLPTELAQAQAGAAEAEFLQAFQSAFGYRLGRLTQLGARTLWPLQRLRAEMDVSDRIVLIGNAAQTIHPLGAQGFNLGLRDAVALARALAEAPDFASAELRQTLAQFSQSRKADRAQTLQFSDQGLVATQNTTPLARIARSLAFTALETMPLLKHSLSRFGLGFKR